MCNIYEPVAAMCESVHAECMPQILERERFGIKMQMAKHVSEFRTVRKKSLNISPETKTAATKRRRDRDTKRRKRWKIHLTESV